MSMHGQHAIIPINNYFALNVDVLR